MSIPISIVAERLSARQLILHRISPSVCMCVRPSRFRNAINMRLQLYAAQQLLRTPHIWIGVCMHATRVHIRPPMWNSDDRVRRLATLRKRKQRVKDCSDSKSLNFGKRRISVNLLTSYCRLSHATLATARSIDTTCSVQIHVEYPIQHVPRASCITQCNDQYQHLLL